MGLFQKEENHGYIPDSFDPRDAWADEILGEDESEIPATYTTENLPYERQGAYPFCVSFACTTLLEHLYKKEGENLRLSQPHLFFHAGGTKTGSGFRANLDVLRNKGSVSYDKFPMPDVKYGRGDDWYERLKPQALKVPFDEVWMLSGYVRVKNDEISLKRARMAYGPLLVGVSTKGGYYKGNGVREGKDNHAILLTGWTPTQWEIFDSLSWVQGKGGYGTLNINYEFYSAYAVTELPKNWKKKVEKVRSKGYENALNHYGKPRNWQAEKDAETQLLAEFKRFNNQSVFDAAGRFWAVLINAAAYGGYSISYRKLGLWQPGDLINFVYQYRRTGDDLALFDLNKERVQ